MSSRYGLNDQRNRLTEATKHAPAGTAVGGQFVKGHTGGVSITPPSKAGGGSTTSPSKHYTIVGKGVKPQKFADRMDAVVHKDTEQSAGRMHPKAYVRSKTTKPSTT